MYHKLSPILSCRRSHNKLPRSRWLLVSSMRRFFYCSKGTFAVYSVIVGASAQAHFPDSLSD